LQWQDTRAFVRVRKIEKFVEIQITGRQKRDLLATIRQQFDSINSSSKKVEVTEQIPCPCSPGCQNRFNYQRLLEAEWKELKSVQCQTQWNDVLLSSLLDGYQQREDRVREFQEEHGPTTYNVDTMIVTGPRVSTRKEVKNVTKQVKTIKIGGKAEINAPVTIADTIQNSFNTLAESKVNDDLKTLLDELLKAVTEANNQVPSDKAEEGKRMARDAKMLIEEAVSSEPRRQWYEISLDGLLKAATNIGKLAGPVVTIVGKLRPLLLP
jgi:hypothetical protein